MAKDADGYCLFMNLKGKNFKFSFWRKLMQNQSNLECECYKYGIHFEADERKLLLTKADEEYRMEQTGLDEEDVGDFLNAVCMMFLTELGEHFDVACYDKGWTEA